MSISEKMDALIAAADAKSNVCPLCGGNLGTIYPSDGGVIVLCKTCMIALAK